ncbi:MAG: hypothetical protein WBD67_11485 [Terracidiphilus sp.]
MKLRYWILPLLLLAPLAQISQAQNDDWPVVKQLPHGQKIKVVTADGKSHKGAVESVTDDSILLKNNQTFKKQDVRQVLMRKGGHRGRNALIGAAIGAAAGLGIGAALDSGGKGEIVNFGNKGIAIATPGLAAVGLLIGAALPSHGKWFEVYRGM